MKNTKRLLALLLAVVMTVCSLPLSVFAEDTSVAVYDTVIETELADYLLYQMRQEGDERWAFICHADKPVNPDLCQPHHLRIRLRGAWKLTKYDSLTGEIAPVKAAYAHGWTVYEMPFCDHDSLLMHMTPADAAETARMFDVLLGDAIADRKKFITDFGHLYINQADI